jgi:hypothetical protein
MGKWIDEIDNPQYWRREASAKAYRSAYPLGQEEPKYCITAVFK